LEEIETPVPTLSLPFDGIDVKNIKFLPINWTSLWGSVYVFPKYKYLASPFVGVDLTAGTEPTVWAESYDWSANIWLTVNLWRHKLVYKVKLDNFPEVTE